MTSQMFSAIAAVTGQGQNPNTTPAQWGSSQYGYSGSTGGGGGGSSSAYHVSAASLHRQLLLFGNVGGSLTFTFGLNELWVQIRQKIWWLYRRLCEDAVDLVMLPVDWWARYFLFSDSKEISTLISNTSSPAGICHTSAAHSNTHDDAELLLHHAQPAGPGHATVPRLHPAVLALSCTHPPTREPRVTPQPPRPPQQQQQRRWRRQQQQQPPWPFVRHAVVVNFIQRTDAAAAAAKVRTGGKMCGRPDVL